MARRRPEDRLERLAEAAAGAFIAQGYRRTQVADVARELGIAKGTVYLCVDSKQALLLLALRHAAGDLEPGAPEALPLGTPAPGETARYVTQRMQGDEGLARLVALLQQPPEQDVADGLSRLVRSLYHLLSRNRMAIKLLDRCAPDVPELAQVDYGSAREGLPDLLAGYLSRRADAGRLRTPIDARVAARMLMETITTWAVHIHWDAAPRSYEPAVVEESLVELARRWWVP